MDGKVPACTAVEMVSGAGEWEGVWGGNGVGCHMSNSLEFGI